MHRFDNGSRRRRILSCKSLFVVGYEGQIDGR